jgi:hypothetical protein
MMHGLTLRSRRAWGATIVALLSAVTLSLWTLAPSNAAVQSSPLGDVGPIGAKLEELHQGAAARHEGDEDEAYEQATSWGHAITPERAASLAQQVARTLGLPSLQHNYIELQTRNGRAVYGVRFGAIWVFIDAELGTVVS